MRHGYHASPPLLHGWGWGAFRAILEPSMRAPRVQALLRAFSGAVPCAVLLLLAVAAGPSRAGSSAGVSASDTELRFVREGRTVKQIDLETLKRSCKVETITLDDPYYGRRMSFLAFPLRQVLAAGFGTLAEELRGLDLFLRARDGYVKPTTGDRLVEDGAYLAFADAAHAHGADPGWQPIDRRQVDPGPYYLVWTKPEQRDPHRYPWPYQLTSIEIVSYAAEYPDTIPRTAERGSPAWTGFEIFKAECIACHAINGQGGKIGPDLNVPKSIVEYRPSEQVKQYIRNPEAFRHTSMPAHEHLSAAQLDALIAYFETMKTLKHDPEAPR
jgi:mono/diheme cytochrome c family protein